MSNNSVLSENVIIEVGEVVGETIMSNNVQVGTENIVTFNQCDDHGAGDSAFNSPYQQTGYSGSLVGDVTTVGTVGACNQISVPITSLPSTSNSSDSDKLLLIDLDVSASSTPAFTNNPTSSSSPFTVNNGQVNDMNVQGRSLYLEDTTMSNINVLCAEVVDKKNPSKLIVKGTGKDLSNNLSQQFPTLINEPEKYNWYTSAYQHSGLWNSKGSGFRWSTRRSSDILSYEGEVNTGTYKTNPNFLDTGKLGIRSKEFSQGLDFWELKIDVASINNAKIDILTDNPSNPVVGTFASGIYDTIHRPGVYTFCIPKLLSSDDWGSGSTGDVLLDSGILDPFINSVTLLKARILNPGQVSNLPGLPSAPNPASIVINSISIKKMTGNFTTTVVPIYGSTVSFPVLDYSWDRLDVFDSKSLPLSFNFVSSDLKKLGSVGSGYSKTFKIPNNSHNQSVLTPLLSVASHRNLEKLKWMKCRVKTNGIYVFSGYLRVESGSTGAGGSFSCHIIEDKISWVEDIGDKSLCDLSFPMVTKNYQNIIDSWQYNADDADCMFGLINYGEWSGQNNQTPTYDKGLGDFHPNIFTKRVVDRIFNSAGYSIESNFFNTSFFKGLVNPYSSGEDYSSDNPFGDSGNNFAEATRNVKYDPFGKIPSRSFGSLVHRSSYSSLIEQSDVNNNYVSGSNSSFGYTTPFSGDYQVYARATIYVSQNILANINNGTGTKMYLEVHKNGVLLQSPTPVSGDIFAQSNNNNATMGITFEVDGIHSMQSGDVISLHLRATNYSNIWPSFCDVSDIEFHSYPVAGVVVPTQDINLNKVLPCDVKQIDFIKGLTQMYNLQWTVDEEKKIVYTEPFDDFSGSGKTVDWTDKIDHSNWSDKFIIKDINKEIYFSYKDDNNDKIMEKRNTHSGTELWSLYLVNPERFKKGVVDLGTTVFSPTLSFNKGVGDQSFNGMGNNNPIIPVMWSDNCSSSWLDDENRPERKYKYNIRILNYYGLDNNIASWNFIDESGVSHTHSEYPYVGTWRKVSSSSIIDNYCLSWADEEDNNITSHGLFSKYWISSFNKANGGSALRTCNINLTPLDIALFDYRDLVHLEIDGVSTYWTVNKIIDYKPTSQQLTKVELIEYKNGLNYKSYTAGLNNSHSAFSTQGSEETIVSQSAGEGLVLKNNTKNSSRGTGIAFGNGVTANNNQTVIGNYNKDSNDDILQVGAGLSNKNRTTALSVNKEGEVQIHGGEIVSEETDGLYSSLVYTDDEGNIKKLYLKK